MARQILVSGDFSDLQSGDDVTTVAAGGQVIPGIVVLARDSHVIILYPHFSDPKAQFSLVTNRAAITMRHRLGFAGLSEALSEAAINIDTRLG